MLIIDYRVGRIRDIEKEELFWLPPEAYIKVIEHPVLDETYCYRYKLNGEDKYLDWHFTVIEMQYGFNFEVANYLFLKRYGLRVEDVSLYSKVLYLSKETIEKG